MEMIGNFKHCHPNFLKKIRRAFFAIFYSTDPGIELLIFICLQSHLVSLLKMEDVTRHVPTMETLLSVRAENLTSNLELMESLVIRFIHVISQTMVDAQIHVRRKAMMLNVYVLKDVK